MLKFKENLVYKQKQEQQRINKNMNVLEKCLQIPFADRLIIRKLLIDREPKILLIFDGAQETKSLEEVQLRLKKFISSAKSMTPKNRVQANRVVRNLSQKRLSVQKNQRYSCKNQKQVSPVRDENKRKMILDVGQIKKKLKQRNHRQNQQQLRSIDEKIKIKRNYSQKWSFNPQTLSSYLRVSSPQNATNSQKHHFNSTQPVPSTKNLEFEHHLLINSIKQQRFDPHQQLKQDNRQLKSLVQRKIKSKLKNSQESQSIKINFPTNNQQLLKIYPVHQFKVNNSEPSKNIEEDSQFGKFYSKIKEIMKIGSQTWQIS